MLENLDVDAFVTQIVTVVTDYGLQVLGAFAVLIVGRMVASWLRGAVAKAMGRRNLDPTLIPFLSGMVYWLVMAIVVIAVLNLFNVEATGLVAILGAAGLAVGLALQGTLSSFASGVMLLIFRPFGVGDLIDAGGASGIVESIGLFSTTLNSLDNVRIVVPNGEVYGKTIKNYSANPTRRVDMTVGVGYGDDLGKAHDTILKIVTADARVLSNPAPDVEVVEMGDSSVNFVVRPWVQNSDYWPVHFALTRALKEGLEAAGCSIPFPQRDVHMRQVQ